MSSMEDDICNVSVDFAATATAAPPAVGSTATDRASKRIRMVRPRCIRPTKIADFRALGSRDGSPTVLTPPCAAQQNADPNDRDGSIVSITAAQPWQPLHPDQQT